VAFEKDSGKVLWKATDDEASYSSPAMATIDGKRHAFFFTRSGLTDLDPENGTVRFQFPWRARADASVNAATPLVAGDLVFISASYQTGAALLKIKGSEVEKVWSSDDVLSNHYATSILYQGYLYGFDGRQEYRPRLRSVELKTGKVSWTKERFGAGTVTLAGDRLLILKESGDLLLAPATPGGFKVTAEAKVLPETVRAYPALASGRLYARSQDTLVCVDLRKTKG
jgi:outer membrane protein assembly factor BamB